MTWLRLSLRPLAEAIGHEFDSRMLHSGQRVETLPKRCHGIVAWHACPLAIDLISHQVTREGPIKMDVRYHKGFGHGLTPGQTQDLNCSSCQREKAEGQEPNITRYDEKFRLVSCSCP